MNSALSSFIEPRWVSPLTSLSGFVVSGPDAKAFLQGQLTNDVQQADGLHHQRTGYCSPKGRLLATMLQWRVSEEAYAHVLPAESLGRISQRLKMFVLRAKAKFSAPEQALAVLGVWGRPGEKLSAIPAADREGMVFDLGGQIPTAEAQEPMSGPWLLIETPCPVLGDRAWVVGSKDRIDQVISNIKNGSQVTENQWFFSEIMSGKTWVWESTQERFVPQMVNFELIRGVSFTKGCYPGQEVVARSQYLGKLKRRTYRADVATEAMTDAEIAALIGQDIWSGGSVQEPCGQVVNAAPFFDPQGVRLPKVALLLETTMDAWDAGNLRLGSLDGPILEPARLPYALAQAV